jgi:Lipocalin-like domain
MKKIFFGFLALVVLSIGCGTKDATEPSLALTKENILGKWNLNDQRVKVSVLGFAQDTTEKFDASSYFDFKSNNKVYVYGKLQGDTAAATLDSIDYKIENNKLTLLMPNLFAEAFPTELANESQFSVTILTNKKLQLSTEFKIPPSDSTIATDLSFWINASR